MKQVVDSAFGKHSNQVKSWNFEMDYGSFVWNLNAAFM